MMLRAEATASAAYPYDLRLRGSWADQQFAIHQAKYPAGSQQRARFLLGVISHGFPTPHLTDAYLETLDALLARHPVLSEPAQLVLGLGTGRTGSTSLTAMIATIPGAV